MQNRPSVVSQIDDLQYSKPVGWNVPPEKYQRLLLRDIARDYVCERKLSAPLSTQALIGHAEKIMAMAQLQGQYHEYTAVLLNNELWRDRFAKMPYDRRLLLLPKCVRKRDKCLGKMDEYGLVCGHCGSCPIHQLQEEAERLGYVVLVAEGSPVVMGLIGSGQIEAVIGVSCLSVLKEVFPYMEVAGICGIALPLLQDGCEETSFDMDWLWEAIHLDSDESDVGRDLKALRSEINNWFTDESLEMILGQAESDTERIAQQWLSKAGKRWRPFLAASVYAAFTGHDGCDLPKHVRTTAVAVECFHKASLIHDDIEDGDSLRYGQETLHEQYGTEIALNVGDFLLGEGYRLIGKCELSLEQKERMLRMTAQGHRELCIGQGAELAWKREPRVLSSREVLAIFARKTAPAFAVATQLGLICAGADAKLCAQLNQYCQSLGTAYQIQDDLADFTGENQRNDVRAMRPSVLLALAYEQATGQERQFLASWWRRCTKVDDSVEQIGSIVTQLDVESQTIELLKKHISQAIVSLEAVDNGELKILLRKIVAKMFNDPVLLVCCYEYQKENAGGR